jgi:hypothetical protein
MEIKIGNRVYDIGAYNVRSMLEMEAWAQNQIIEAAKQIDVDDAIRPIVLAEAAKRAKATGYFSPDSQAIRSSIIGKMYEIFVRCKENNKRLTWIEFEDVCKKNPADFEAAIQVYNAMNYTLPQEPQAPKSDAAPESTT